MSIARFVSIYTGMLFDCLQNAPQPTLDGIRKITLGLISRLYNYTAVNPFG